MNLLSTVYINEQAKHFTFFFFSIMTVETGVWPTQAEVTGVITVHVCDAKQGRKWIRSVLELVRGIDMIQ